MPKGRQVFVLKATCVRAKGRQVLVLKATCGVQVNAQKMPELAAHLQVTAAPTFVFLHRGDTVDRVEGFDPAGLYNAAEKLTALAPQAGGLDATGDITTQLKALVRKDPVMLFMKGSPEEPRCGFSRRVVDALRGAHIPFGHFDILLNETVRPCTHSGSLPRSAPSFKQRS